MQASIRAFLLINSCTQTHSMAEILWLLVPSEAVCLYPVSKNHFMAKVLEAMTTQPGG